MVLVLIHRLAKRYVLEADQRVSAAHSAVRKRVTYG
jgi:hypothetical protein